MTTVRAGYGYGYGPGYGYGYAPAYDYGYTAISRNIGAGAMAITSRHPRQRQW
jgi:hypothetical protein